MIELGDDIVSTGERTWAHRWCAIAVGHDTVQGEDAGAARWDGTSTDDMGY